MIGFGHETQRRPGRVKTLVALAGLASLTLVITVVFAHDPHEAPGGSGYDPDAPKSPSPEAMRALGIATAEVGFGTVNQILKLTGYVVVDPAQTREMSVQADGVVTSISVRLGEQVRAGQEIARVRLPEIGRLAIEFAQRSAEVAKFKSERAANQLNVPALAAQAALKQLQIQVAEEELSRLEIAQDSVGQNLVAQRRQALLELKAKSSEIQQALEQARASEAWLSAQISSAEQIERQTKAALEAMGAGGVGEDAGNMPEVTLRAPIAGVVSTLEARVGQGVSAGQSIVEIVDQSRMVIEGELPEGQVGRVGEMMGQECRVRRAGARGDEPALVVGRVRGLGPRVDPVKRTSHVLIDVENAPVSAGNTRPLREGMFVGLSVVVGEAKDVVVIPAGALVSDGPVPCVYVREQDHFHKREVVPGGRDDRVIEIVDGLVPGDEIVVTGAYLLMQMRNPGAAAESGHDHDHGHSH